MTSVCSSHGPWNFVQEAMTLSVVVLQKNRFQKSWQSHHVTDLLAVFFPLCSGVNEVEVHYF